MRVGGAHSEHGEEELEENVRRKHCGVTLLKYAEQVNVVINPFEEIITPGQILQKLGIINNKQ